MNVVDGNLLILASAGSGKTYQLGNRVIGRVAAGVEPEKIVALTFTRKAAGEFADSVLGKLAEGVLDERRADGLRGELELPAADFQDVLERIVRALPKFTLTTIDSFFTRIVRGFQYELGLTGGKFDLLEGPRAAAVREALISDLLGNRVDEAAAVDFARAFRRAMVGREAVSVRSGVGEYVNAWHRRFLNAAPLEWGPGFLFTSRPQDWESEKHALARAAIEACDSIVESRKGQADQVRKFIRNVEAHVVSGRDFPTDGKLATGILDALWSGAEGDAELQFHKPFTLPGDALVAIGRLVRLAAGAEMGAAVLRTRAIARVLEGYDRLAESRLRRRGLLGFDDVKRLMGAWQGNEDDRLRRESVDFRLDARYEHWLLDEFQDTSREEWLGLLPLLHEAVQGGGAGSLFIVGDRKQAIYGWRGGDVSLFNEIKSAFGQAIEERPMADSWRSCPEVLDLVNRVCGRADLIAEMFGIDATRWVWDEHRSAGRLRDADSSGEACVELFDVSEKPSNEEHEDATEPLPADPRIDRMVERMRQLGVGRKDLTCAVLVRRNQEGREIADALRARGFDVVLDGVRRPTRDHPLGVTALQLIRWLANPDDTHAKRAVEMSPLSVHPRCEQAAMDYEAWQSLHDEAQSRGFSKLVEARFAPLLADVSAYGRERFSEIIEALAVLDQEGVSDPNVVADRLERLEVPQNPGAAAVQVMTIHKSKGLGFDVVFLPDVPDVVIPEARRFKIAEGEGWITEVPPTWARGFFPPLRDAEQKWAADQAYEALCQLYVALTRAKRGLYVYLGKSAKSAKTESSTMTNWILRALGGHLAFGTVFHAGNPDWSASISEKPNAQSIIAPIHLAPPVTKRKRISVSMPHADQSESQAVVSGSSRRRGREFGTRVHRVLEQVEWCDDPGASGFPDDEAGRCVRSLLGDPAIARVFRRPDHPVEVLREQWVDGIDGNTWISGVIDRIHLHRIEQGGPVMRLEIFDFKTDSGADESTLLLRHAPQLRGYGRMVGRLFPGTQIDLLILATALRRIIRVE